MLLNYTYYKYVDMCVYDCLCVSHICIKKDVADAFPYKLLTLAAGKSLCMSIVFSIKEIFLGNKAYR